MSALTIEKIYEAARLMKQMPAPVGWYSHSMFPADQATTFEDETGERFCIAHPDFWNRAFAAIKKDIPTTYVVVDLRISTQAYMGMRVINIDADTPERARVIGAMMRVMQAAIDRTSAGQKSDTLSDAESDGL